jgi:Flp pilus assembly protein TadB
LAFKKSDSSTEFVVQQLGLMQQKASDSIQLKLEENRLTQELALNLIQQRQEEDRLTQELASNSIQQRQEEDRLMLKAVMQMLQKKDNPVVKPGRTPPVAFFLLAIGSLLCVLLILLLFKGRAEQQNLEGGFII